MDFGFIMDLVTDRRLRTSHWGLAVGPDEPGSFGREPRFDRDPAETFHVGIGKKVVGGACMALDVHLAGKGLGAEASAGGIGEMKMIGAVEIALNAQAS